MPAPRVFVSSTWYDLRYIRENLSFFIRSLGYEPVLFEDGGVYFDPSSDIASAAVSEVNNCQMFVLVIGGRYGSRMPDSTTSVTNAEYRTAAESNVPIFAMVEQNVHNDLDVYRANIQSDAIDERKIKYPSVDDPAIFDFIREVQSRSVNNAIVPFRDFSDIEQYLKQQWAAMTHQFLSRDIGEAQVASTLDALKDVSQRVEVLSSQILRSVGSPEAKLSVDIYELMISNKAIQHLTWFGGAPDPKTLVKNATLLGAAEDIGLKITVTDAKGYITSGSGTDSKMTRGRFIEASEEYEELRRTVLAMLDATNIDEKKFLAD